MDPIESIAGDALVEAVRLSKLNAKLLKALRETKGALQAALLIMTDPKARDIALEIIKDARDAIAEAEGRS